MSMGYNDEHGCMCMDAASPHQLQQLFPLTCSEGPTLAFDHLPCHVSVDEVPQRLFGKEGEGKGVMMDAVMEGGCVCIDLCK